jgi:hypothetical protein
MSLKFSVTESHLDRAIDLLKTNERDFRSPVMCAVALAVQEATSNPNAKVGLMYVHVEDDVYRINRLVQDLTYRFDMGQFSVLRKQLPVDVELSELHL